MSLQGSTVLVTGATGFLGGHIVQRLAAEGAQVRALARRPGRDRYIHDLPGVEIVMGDITDAGRLQEVTQGCDYVFHAAAALGGPLHHQRRVNVEGTRGLMLAAAAAGVRRVVHISTVAVYGYRVCGDIHEDHPQQPGRVAYNLSKSETETVVRETAAQHNLSYSIMRPGMIYGPRSNAWTVTLFKMARRRPVFWVGSGKQGHAHPIYIGDVVDLALLLATHPAADGQAFNCTPDPAPTWRQFIGAYSRLAAHERWLGLPVILARLLALPADLLLTLRGQPQDLPQMVGYITSPMTYPTEKARTLLGWQPQITLEEGIARCAPYLREKGLLR